RPSSASSIWRAPTWTASRGTSTGRSPTHRWVSRIRPRSGCGTRSPRLAYFFPSTETGLQLHYRYYFDVYPGTAPTTMGPNLGAGYLQQPGYDPWQVQSHTIEGRIYQQLSPTLQARFTLRIYHQSQAAFWCDTLGNPSCYPPQGQFSITGTPESTDPKLGPVNTEYPEVKLIWDAEALRDVPFFRWFAGGTFEISYGYYYQSTSFGDAHVLQTGYTMPY